MTNSSTCSAPLISYPVQIPQRWPSTSAIDGQAGRGWWSQEPASFFQQVLIVIGFAWAYVRYGSIPQVKGVLYGIKPVIIAIVVQALWSLGRAAMKSKFLALIGIAATLLTFLGLHELLVLLGGGLVVVAVRLIG